MTVIKPKKKKWGKIALLILAILAATPLTPVQEAGSHIMTDYGYDITGVKCPVLLLSGTEGDFEVQTVIPPEEMFSMYDRLSIPKVISAWITTA